MQEAIFSRQRMDRKSREKEVPARMLERLRRIETQPLEAPLLVFHGQTERNTVSYGRISSRLTESSALSLQQVKHGSEVRVRRLYTMGSRQHWSTLSGLFTDQ